MLDTGKLKKFASKARADLIDQVSAKLDHVLSTDSAELREKEKALQELKKQISATSKEAVIDELVQSLLDAGEIAADQRDDIIAAIMKREELGSTGIGRGVAVPHTKHPSVSQLVGTVGVSEQGVDFDSLDGERVQLFFLLISPPERPGDHLRALENISRQLRDESFCRFLKQSKTSEDIQQLLQEADDNQFAAG